MQTVQDIQDWLLWIVWVGVLVLQAWAVVDCLTRKTAAFPAAGKLTKPTWLLLTLLALLLVLLLRGVVNILSYIAVIVSSVYLADVRPAVREISGPSRW